MKKFIVFSILFIGILKSTCAQIQRDQDLVTLKNGYQLLGYVIEQKPGKAIKVYRPLENDTMEVALSEISKLSKIWVQPFSEKKIEKRDSILPGRFNNKLVVFSLGYVMQWKDIERHERRGLSFAMHRRINHRYHLGFNTLLFGCQNPEPQRSDYSGAIANHDFLQFHFLLSNQIRLGRKMQNQRFSMMINLQSGWIFDRSKTYVNAVNEPFSVRQENHKNGFTIQTSMAFRINPDNQSGFSIEPGYAFFPQQVEQFNGEPGIAGTVYLGYRREINHLFSLKLSYFF